MNPQQRLQPEVGWRFGRRRWLRGWRSTRPGCSAAGCIAPLKNSPAGAWPRCRSSQKHFMSSHRSGPRRRSRRRPRLRPHRPRTAIWSEAQQSPARPTRSDPASVPSFAASTASGECGKRQRTDEQAHREADPAQDRRPVKLAPTGALGSRREAGLHGQPQRAEHAELLADEQAGEDRQRQRPGESADASDMNPRADEAEQGHDSEHHPGMDIVLEALERRVRLATPSGTVSAARTPAIVAWIPLASMEYQRKAKPSR